MTKRLNYTENNTKDSTNHSARLPQGAYESNHAHKPQTQSTSISQPKLLAQKFQLKKLVVISNDGPGNLTSGGSNV